MFGGDPTRRRPSPALDAREARDAAAEAFYRMDQAQQDTNRQVDTYTGLYSGTPPAARVRAAFDALNAHCEEMARAYIATLDRYDVDKELPKATFLEAQVQLRHIAHALDQATQHVENFRQQYAAELARVGEALAQVGPKIIGAQQALAAAETAVAKLEQEGLTPGLAGDALAGARAGAQVLAKGADLLGIAGALRQAEQVTLLAERAQGLAEDLPRKRDEVTRRLSSLRTRNEGVAHRIATVEKGLSELRRGYRENCWRDIARAAQVMEERTQVAADFREQAAAAARAGNYDDAMEALRRATQSLAEAESHERAVAERRTALQEAAHDPSARIAKVRFRLRDAQRLAMADTPPGAEPTRWAARLDPLVHRLENVEAVLEGPHPDYWRFLTELSAISDAIARVVLEIRNNRGAR